MALPEDLGNKEYYILQTCPHCHGSGSVPEYPSNITVPPTTTTTCPECEGDGKVSVGEIWSKN